MLHEPDLSNEAIKLNWPNECQTIVKLSPLLLAGMSGNRPTMHHLIRSESNLDSNLPCREKINLPNLKSEKIMLLKRIGTNGNVGQKAQRAVIHSKKLFEELIIPPIPQSPNDNQNKIKHNDKPASFTPAESMVLKSDTREISRPSRRIKDCVYTFVRNDSKEESTNLIQNHQIQSDPALFVDDRNFARSYYNRKNEKDIYSKPPNMRRVLLKIKASDPEYGINQNWITSWEPTDDFIHKSLKNVSLKSANGNFAMKRKQNQSQQKNRIHKDYLKPQGQINKDSYCSYSLPKRQEYKPLDGEFVAHLVEIQTGHVAHHHRKMRPTLGVSKLQKETRLIHIGPSTKQMNHSYLNEDPDDLDLALQICNLSLEEKSFIQDLSNLTHKLELSYRRARNKRKKKSSHLFRNLQSHVEHLVNSGTCDNMTDVLRSQMEKFLIACRKDQIFLDTISINYNPWAKNDSEISS